MIFLEFIEPGDGDDVRHIAWQRGTRGSRVLANGVDVDRVGQDGDLLQPVAEHPVGFVAHLRVQCGNTVVAAVLLEQTAHAPAAAAEPGDEAEVVDADPGHPEAAGKAPQRQVVVDDDVYVARQFGDTPPDVRTHRERAVKVTSNPAHFVELACVAAVLEIAQPLRTHQDFNGNVIRNQGAKALRQHRRRVRDRQCGPETLAIEDAQPLDQRRFDPAVPEIGYVKQHANTRVRTFGIPASAMISIMLSIVGLCT